MARPTTIDEYLAALPAETREVLEELRSSIHELVPDVEESINYDMPGFRYRGTWLVGFGAFSKHCTFFPGTVKFTADEPIRRSEVERIVRGRVAHVDGGRQP
jgi:uncharacterized protein YdhG (YjbR/CyaY superfamily)